MAASYPRPMPQIHLHAEPGDYAPLVLMPGDPVRARRIADRFDGGIENAKLVNENRGLHGWTGTYHRRPVSVQTTGMGTPGGLREVVWMGGTLEERGNTTETGEWNACVDPEAAEMCLASGTIRRLFPLDATQDVVFTMDDLRVLPDTHLAGIVRDAIRFYVGFHRRVDGIDGCYLHDPVTLIAALLR